MKLKTLIVSIVLLAVVSGAVFFARRPGPPPSQDSRLGQPVIDRTVVDKAAKLRISDQGKTVVLTRQTDGTWHDTSYFDLPADFSKLSGFVGSLTEAKLDRLVTTNPDRIARLEFKDTKIELLDSSDKPVWTLTLGKNAESGTGRFLRFDDEKKAYLASLNAWIDTEAKSWANAELLAIKAEDIAKVEVEFPATSANAAEPKTAEAPASKLTVSREKKESAWTSDHTPTGQQVKAERVTSLLGYVGTLRFTDTNDLTDPNVAAAKAHLRTCKVTTFDGKTYTIAMGRKPEEKKLKPPVSSTGQSGPASLGSVSDLSKKEGDKKEESKPAAPEFETIPAGPVFAFVTSTDANAPINAVMQKRAFQIGDYLFTSLPQKPDELFEPAPVPAPAPAATSGPAPAPAASAAAPEKAATPGK